MTTLEFNRIVSRLDIECEKANELWKLAHANGDETMQAYTQGLTASLVKARHIAVEVRDAMDSHQSY